MKYTLVVLLLVCMAIIVGAEVPGASAEKDRTGGVARALERTGDAVVGASIVHPEQLVVERERYTYDGTYGYTLWKPDPEENIDGGDPQVRVALAYDLKPGQIEARIRERIAQYPDLNMVRETVSVGEKKLKGVGIGPIPGSTPSTEVYVAEKGHVYQINVYGEELDAKGKELLSSLRLEKPSRSVASLKLKDGKKAETHQDLGASKASEKEREARLDAAEKVAAAKATAGPPAEKGASSSGPVFQTMAATPVYAEYQINEGCWRADSRTYFQTQHGWGANASPSDGIPTDFSLVGRPNYWGQYTHGSLGYGRCASTYYTNDKFAIDYPLDRGNQVFAPFYRGTVVFAGRNYSHKNYGIFVVIRDSNNRYVSISGHLNGLAAGIKRGAVVNAGTIIGFAGNTGDPSIPVGEVHLHQAFYRYPYLKPDGSPYGGRGLQAVYHRYVGRPGVRAGGVYQFVDTTVRQSTLAQKTKGELISN